MTGYLIAKLRELVLDPQATVGTVERRAYVDPDGTPVTANAQEIDVAAMSTVIIGETTGRSLDLRHTLSVLLSVEHGDPVEATRLRDAIVVDLVVRFLTTRPALLAAVDPASGQYGTDASLEVSYAPLDVIPDALIEYATLTVTVDTTLDLA